MTFFHNGTTIGFSLSGVSGLLILIYLIIEISSLLVTRVFFWRKLVIGFRVWNQVRKTIPKWWKIKGISITIGKKENNLLDWNYECYVEVQSKYSELFWTNDYVKTNKWGKIVRCDLYDEIKSYDRGNEDKIKQWNRDQIINDLLNG